MQQLICELCGRAEFVKQGEYFVCQGCGTKYSVEEAKALMMSDAAGTNSVANSYGEQFKNLLIIAEDNLEGGTWDTGFHACEKAIEMVPQSKEAWGLKAKYLIRHGNRAQNEIVSAINAAGKYTEGDTSQVVDALVKFRFARFAEDAKKNRERLGRFASRFTNTA